VHGALVVHPHPIVIDHRHRAAHDVHPAASRKVRHERVDGRRLVGEVLDLFLNGPAGIAECQQLRAEVLRKDHQIGVVILGRPHQGLDLIGELFEAFNGTDVVLQRSDADSGH